MIQVQNSTSAETRWPFQFEIGWFRNMTIKEGCGVSICMDLSWDR